jgi:hypothetical protein
MPASFLSCAPEDWSEDESMSQLLWSPEFRCLFGSGESPGVRERFSPRERMLESVSAVDVAELDIRRES